MSRNRLLVIPPIHDISKPELFLHHAESQRRRNVHVRNALPVPQGVVLVVEWRKSLQSAPANVLDGITAAAALSRRRHRRKCNDVTCSPTRATYLLRSPPAGDNIAPASSSKRASLLTIVVVAVATGRYRSSRWL